MRPIHRLIPGALGAALVAGALMTTSVQANPLRWAAQNDVLTLDPHSQNHATTNAILMHAYEGLTRYDKDYKVEPALATSWQQMGPTQWRFNLRKGVKFHDGSLILIPIFLNSVFAFL